MKRKFCKDRKMAAGLAAGILISLAAAGTVLGAGPAGDIAGAAAAVTSPAVQQEEQGYRWELRDNKWYCCTLTGVPVYGWVKDGGKYYYLSSDGAMLTDWFTPDGYYVNHSGEWYPRTASILGSSFTAAEKYPSAAGVWAGQEALFELKSDVEDIFIQRGLNVSADRIEYYNPVTGKTLMGLYKNTDTNSYRLDIGIQLDSNCTDLRKTAAYEYQIFRAMIYQATSSPELLEAAVYGSWEGENEWSMSRTEWIRVGDVQVKYAASNGYGCYYIYPVKPE